jgi:hypothetical protein
MAIRKVFYENCSELECYINADGKLYIGINMNRPDLGHGESIALDIADVRELIRELIEYREEMEGIIEESKE